MTMKRYPDYKDSGVEWLGEVPSEWQISPIKHIAFVNRETLPENTDKERRIKYIDIGNVGQGVFLNEPQEMLFKDAPSRARRIVKNGDVIVSTVRTYLKAVAYIDRDNPDLIASTGFAVVTPTERLHSRYLFYVLSSQQFVDTVSARSVGVSYPAINSSVFGDIRVWYPTLEEQRAIAAYLDRKTQEIDALIEKKQALIALLREQRTALINRAVTKGLDSDVPMKDSGVEWLGEVPAHWGMVAIKRTARDGYKTFTDGDWVELPFITDDGVRLIQTGNIGIGEYREKGFRYISEKSFHELNCTEVEPGNVLICRLDGPVGRACLAPELAARMITSVDNAILKPSPAYDSRFLVYSMSSSRYLTWMQALCRVGGGFRFRISRSMLGDVRIANPPIHEQRLIADYLDRNTSEIDSLVQREESLIELLQELRTSLISEVVTGKIDVRDAVDDEQTRRVFETRRV